jgi:hypothetical protein
MSLESNALTLHETPRRTRTMPAPDTIPDLPIWPSGVARLADGATAAASTPRGRLRFGARASCLAVLAVGAALAAAAYTPSDASAATQRYASPTGGGDCSSSATPCSITQAISGAGSGGEVIVLPGDYSVTDPVNVADPVTIHGVDGQSRPRLVFKGAGQSGMRLPQGALLRHVEIVQEEASYSALVLNGAKADQVVLSKSTGSQCTAVTFNNSTIRNSVVVASGSGATALCASGVGGVLSPSSYRNVTAVATGSNGVAIEAYAANQWSRATAELVNVIAKGGPNGAGLWMHTDGSIGAMATITAIHSNFANAWTAPPAAYLVTGGGNQGTPPNFVNAATGNYHQAAGSVTIGAGIDNDQANGALDVDGDPRRIGTTDIGADEFVPPAQPSPSPSPSPAPPAPPAPPTSSSPSAQPFAGVDLVSRKLTYARRAITVGLRCPAGTVGRCSGRTTLTARPRRTVTLGGARFSIAPGSRATVKVRVTRAGRRLLNRLPRLRGRAVNVARDGASQSKTIRAAVTIRRRHR